ncbi:helicase HerA domain-containing protein [Calycomorphotria hydatis]|uniref:AAA-like domain protein n=1 Tax=Calycomorphotria hydatis TaxID=2528027 RepID=A0A517T8G6_9PLAN|nr:DUF87 domain-containing protein [Calycomorphotria hydatis]QDT64657.1 AAA-like domain protein [Calycomorphotria hydatis]
MNYEKLGAFYLGRSYNLAEQRLEKALYLYDAKDLTTHALCVGMTGSGKTGLCLSLIEEAAIDQVPVIAIDPKGDLGNLMLTFPNLSPEEFRPWVDERAALNAGKTPDEFAAASAKLWKEGLAQWDQTAERVKKFKDSVDIAIYTPGSNIGLPMTVLKSFDAPPEEVINDAETFRERISSASSGLLSLIGVDADPVQSREHILLTNILDREWRAGRSLTMESLITLIQTPPFEKIGVLDLEAFYPSKDRMKLAMQMNNLLASPTFSGWLEGEPLNIEKLLFTDEGKPRISILSIAHLSDQERMFFVTLLLGEVLSWVRTQPGTSSLRALLYMDEVFGYFPPSANPPSKRPMLMLLKQARAFGLGVVLATQNPVDLDYKGLSNIGTWFLGRLQTERDKARVLEGLEGASTQAGTDFNRQEMEATLAALGGRVFLVNNVHEDGPLVFQTRWALSYLRGPLSRQQIETLMADRKAIHEEKQAAKKQEQQESIPATPPKAEPPVIPANIPQLMIKPSTTADSSTRIVYRPALLGRARLHFSRVSYKVNCSKDVVLLRPVKRSVSVHVWDSSEHLSEAEFVELDPAAVSNMNFATPSKDLLKEKSYSTWERKLKDHLYRNERVKVLKCAEFKVYSEPDETEGSFRSRLTQMSREKRDLAVEKLRAKYAARFKTLKGRMDSAEDAIAREKSQAHQATISAAVSFGSSILSAMFGRKLASSTNVRRATTSMRSAGRAAEQHSDISRAELKLDRLEEDWKELEEKMNEDIEQLEAEFDPQHLEIETLEVAPKKSDIVPLPVALVWTPWSVDDQGIAEPAFQLSGED